MTLHRRQTETWVHVPPYQSYHQVMADNLQPPPARLFVDGKGRLWMRVR